MDIDWNEIDTAYVDLDGVLVDFMAGVDSLFGGNGSMPMTDHGIHRHYGLDEPEFWQRIDDAGAEFWAQLQPYFWTSTIMAGLQKRTPGRVFILTSPTWHGSSAHGKIDWMQQHLGQFTDGPAYRDFVITNQKHLLARPGALLVDDRPSLVSQFLALQGEAVLFPQPWNTRTNLEMNRAEVVQALGYLAVGEPPMSA